MSLCARFSSCLGTAGWPKSLDKLVKGRPCHGYGCLERDALIDDSLLDKKELKFAPSSLTSKTFSATKHVFLLLCCSSL